MGCGNILPSRQRTAVKPVAEGECEDVHSANRPCFGGFWKIQNKTKMGMSENGVYPQL